MQSIRVVDRRAEPAPEAGVEGSTWRAVRTIREVAAMTDVGRARVVALEQSALRKLRELFQELGVDCLADFTEVSGTRFAAAASSLDEEPPVRFPAARGWHAVQQIVSLNGGSTFAEDIASAFAFLKARNEVAFRPKLLVSEPQGLEEVGTIETVVPTRHGLRVRRTLKRTGKRLPPSTVTLLVESELGQDSMGPFEVPIVVAAIVAGRAPTA